MVIALQVAGATHAWQIFRAARNMPATTSSFTALALARGIEHGTPRLDAGTGYCWCPRGDQWPALAGISMLCRSAERTMMASGCPISKPSYVARQAVQAAYRDIVQGENLV
jgi:hypothetical protein